MASRTRTMSWTRHHEWRGNETEYDCEVEVSITGRHVRATRLDPAEEPEIEVESVKVKETGEIITDELSASEIDSIIDEAQEHFAESEADERAAALEDAADAARDERRMGF